MYNDNSNFSTRTVIVQFLFVALFIFILIWLFPMKRDLNNAIKGISSNETDLSIFYDQIFNDNVVSMKDAAKSYFTTARLPKKVGDKVKMTLAEMLNAKIILPFVDSEGNQCDLNDSYVEITKNTDEFVMKVNLKCSGDQENYLLVYMGCYDYCDTAVCEKNTADVKTPTVYSSKTNKVVSTNTQTTTPVVNNVINNVVNNVINNNTTVINNGGTTPTKSYLYEYIKTTGGTYVESDWSDWSTTEVTASATTSVRTKTVTAQTLIGYNVTTKQDTTQPIYATEQVVIGYETKTVCKTYDYVSTGSATYGDWSYTGTQYFTYSPANTSTTMYVWVDDDNAACTSNCTAGTTGYYKVYTRSSSPVTEYKCTSYGTEQTPVYGTKTVFKGFQTIVVSKVPVYKTVTTKYYSYKTRTLTGGSVDTKWSTYNDTSLLNAGYQYTGNKKEV